MAEFRFNWDQAKLDHGLEEAGRRWANKAGRALVNEAKRNAPVDTGRLRSSISAVTQETDRGVKVIVGSALEYAEYQERGTGIYGPHGTPIVPVTKKALKFKPKGSGKFVFRPSVAGTPATRFLSKALEAVFPGQARTRD
ncbi:hypothetical protein TPB0596_12500 [Tsukamurella pulmonis]|uniref:HK97-gp10 family putative phage morphogenesis protein n=1 Tax=Tsukamurella pulmonis TaxID=47312 RepID=UPI001EE088BB|nr:HK97-gp10 family putative phage morphogenesis protein [Tsukamurella pulmonis]BDD81487.1 hypothetical protein TPB0596_12500 [Tsukamurella pulmonis]